MKRILITRPRAQAEEFGQAVQAAGYEPLFLPVIEIRPLAENQALALALSRLPRYDWVIFTSANAVQVVCECADRPARWPESARVAAVGPKTAQALRAQGLEPAWMPEEYVAEALLPGLGELQGKLVLLPCAELARQDLPQAIAAAGGTAHEITVYQTLPAAPEPAGLAALRAGVDVITCTSPSSVENLLALAQRSGLNPLALPGDPLFACIGPVTASAARAAGLARVLTAEEFTTAGLVQAIQNYMNR